jgi:hypothetical protein
MTREEVAWYLSIPGHAYRPNLYVSNKAIEEIVTLRMTKDDLEIAFNNYTYLHPNCVLMQTMNLEGLNLSCAKFVELLTTQELTIEAFMDIICESPNDVKVAKDTVTSILKGIKTSHLDLILSRLDIHNMDNISKKKKRELIVTEVIRAGLICEEFLILIKK